MTSARARSRLVAWLWLLATAGAGAAANATDPPASIPEYIARLDAITAAVGAEPPALSRAAVLVNALPDPLRLDGSPRIFEIPTGLIQHDFRAWDAQHAPAARRRLLNRLHTLRSEAARFEEPPLAAASQHDTLTGILAGGEFRDVHGPTWTDRLRQRALELFIRLLGRLIRQSAIPTISRILVYGLMAGALLVLALAASRFIHRIAVTETVLAIRPIVPQMDWTLWLAEAQGAAARGDWRDAVHFTYWCAVAFLEARGAWRPDRARTPREYVRLLPPSSDDRATLAALTRRFELVWYGTAGADAEAFAASIANLKKMGCPGA